MSRLKKFRKKIKYSLIYFLVRFLISIANKMPRLTWLAFCGKLGKVACFFATKSRTLSERHLTIAFGEEKSSMEIKKLAQDMFVMLGKNVGDVLRAANIDCLTALNKFVVMKGMQNFDVANNKGKGVVFVACHLGAFEFQITSMALRGLNFMVIGTPLKDKRLNDLMWKHRNKNGTNYVERDKATFPMLKTLKAGGSVALLIDQDTRVKSTFVNFFGKQAYTPVGAAVLAMKTGAAVLPAFSHLGDDGMQHIEILPEIDLRITGNEEEDIQYNTQIFTDMIEARIRQYPTQWLWMHERWKTIEQPLVAIN
ncbi:MAG TPA: lysophospholipid acyltransferase family protein [Cyclobacteriaceae bacterium]|nr:lysophospholipid acyltransferase family protein [Cyclobacteriaceae bacterium]